MHNRAPRSQVARLVDRFSPRVRASSWLAPQKAALRSQGRINAGGMPVDATGAASAATAAEASLMRASVATVPEQLAPLLHAAAARHGPCGRVYIHIEGGWR
jgi:hypothetical protein